MKLAIITIAVLVGLVTARTRFTPNTELDEDWTAWKAKHGKTYSDKDESDRRLIFESNLRKIQHHNLAHSLGEATFTLGANQFADLTAEEFAELMVSGGTSKHRHRHHGRHPHPPHHHHRHHHHHHHHHNKTTTTDRACMTGLNTNVELPPSVDWRTEGYVTPVRSNSSCLDPRLYGITGALEGQWFRKTGQLNALSEQNLNDCVQGGNVGCGPVIWTYDQIYGYIRDTGIETLADYPDGTKPSADTCQYNPAKRAARVSGFDYVSPAKNEKVLQTYVATTGPVSIEFDASQDSFQFYTGGVYDEPKCSPTNADYAALIVGYGTDATGGDYWIVKMNWGTSWGISGYIWMARNKDNQCGIANVATYPFFSC